MYYKTTLILTWLLCEFATIFSEKNVVISEVTAIAGEPAYLPCDISTDDNDSVVLVLWYREDLGTPIYSVDARERDFGIAERWSDESVLASRAYFLPDKQPAQLAIERIHASDEEMYRCRVDFKIAQTRNSKINLTVIVPPERMVITDENGDKKDTILGPYSIGDSFMLRCDVYGGKPRPWVKWYRNDQEVDTPGSILPDGSVRGVLRVANLTRDDVRSTVSCRTSNHVRVLQVDKTLTIDMNFPPLNVRILGSNQPLAAGRRYDLLCQSSGSRPPASITWWKNGKRISNVKESLSSDGNTTTSSVSFVAKHSDAGTNISCRGVNPSLPMLAPLEDTWHIDIHYTPETVVRLGTNLDPNNIREGSDVYFDCIINARPYVHKVEWRHNGHQLVHNIGKGIIISNQSLVLQSVVRNTTGNYTCIGYNSEGEGQSQPFMLNVLFAPTCRQNQRRVHGVAKQERAVISCQVDANPTELQYRWVFNNTANSADVGGSGSTLTYTPLTELDYGTLLCWAQNSIGTQKYPCVYHIIAAGHPDQVHNCTLVNSSLTSIGIRCSEGFNGGLPQTFMLELREITSQELISNITSAVPKFTILNLIPGRIYIASIYSYNAKGRAEPILLKVATLRPPEKRHTADGDTAQSEFRFPGTLSAALGGSGALLITCLLILISLRQRKNRKQGHQHDSSVQAEQSQDKTWTDGTKDDSENDERNPDVVPPEVEHMQVEYIGNRQKVSTVASVTGLTSGSVAGVRGYTALRPHNPHLPHFYEPQMAVPPPIRFATATYTLPRTCTGGYYHPSGSGIALHQLSTIQGGSPPSHLLANTADTPL